MFAPSHGALNGAMVWCVRPSRAVSLLDALHAIDWIRDAVARGFNRVHFHTCCIASSLLELGTSLPNLGDSVVVTAFQGEIKWSSEGPSTADQCPAPVTVTVADTAPVSKSAERGRHWT